MKADTTFKTISITHAPFNPYYAESFGLIFKISYHLERADNPRLEIFRDDAEARQKEWHIYGTLLDGEDRRFAAVSFSAAGEERDFQILSSHYRVVFDGFSSEAEPVYTFRVMPVL